MSIFYRRLHVPYFIKSINTSHSLTHSSLRQSYLQEGGKDPHVLQQLTEMHATARDLEEKARHPPKPQNGFFVCFIFPPFLM